MSSRPSISMIHQFADGPIVSNVSNSFPSLSRFGPALATFFLIFQQMTHSPFHLPASLLVSLKNAYLKINLYNSIWIETIHMCIQLLISPKRVVYLKPLSGRNLGFWIEQILQPPNLFQLFPVCKEHFVFKNKQ